MRKYILPLFAITAILFGCESEKNNDLNKELEKRKNQVPKITDQNQVPQQKIEVMTEFTPEQTKIKDMVVETIYKNLEATQAEDVQTVMETIHEDSPQRSSTERGMDYVFKNYDMAYEIEDLKFISISNEEVNVLYQQTTKSVKGTGFTNTRKIGMHTLKKSKDGRWKIFKTADIKVEPLR